MIPLLIGGLVSGVSSLAGGIADAVQQNKKTKQLEKYQNDLDNWYKEEMATDYLDTSQARSTLSLLQKNKKSELDNLDNNQIKSGYTDEAKVAYAAQLNNNYADQVSKLAGLDTEYKSSVRKSYWDETSSLLDIADKISVKDIGAAVSPLGESIGDYMMSRYI